MENWDHLQAELERCADYDQVRTELQTTQSDGNSLRARVAQLESDKTELQELVSGEWVSKVKLF